jgi:hypothetical protein
MKCAAPKIILPLAAIWCHYTILKLRHGTITNASYVKEISVHNSKTETCAAYMTKMPLHNSKRLRHGSINHFSL